MCFNASTVFRSASIGRKVPCCFILYTNNYETKIYNGSFVSKMCYFRIQRKERKDVKLFGSRQKRFRENSRITRYGGGGEVFQ